MLDCFDCETVPLCRIDVLLAVLDVDTAEQRAVLPRSRRNEVDFWPEPTLFDAGFEDFAHCSRNVVCRLA